MHVGARIHKWKNKKKKKKKEEEGREGRKKRERDGKREDLLF